MADFLSMGLGSTETSLDDRTAQALGMTTTTAFTTPIVGVNLGTDKTMLYLTAAGVILAALALFKKG